MLRVNSEEYVPKSSPPKRPRHPPKKPLTDSLDSSTINKRVSNIMPDLQEIADTENTSLLQLLIIVLVKLCRHFNFPNLANLLYTVFISMIIYVKTILIVNVSGPGKDHI